MNESHQDGNHATHHHESHEDDTELIHDLSIEESHQDMSMKKAFILFGIFIFAGVISGFVLNFVTSGLSTSKQSANSKPIGAEDVVQSEGIADKKTFKDSAEGKLLDGGAESGEGSFHLERPGGDDQTVYLTSSTVDMAKFVGKKVRVHGETFSSEHVGWLMDVGYIEVIK
jgi:hypothetical protein